MLPSLPEYSVRVLPVTTTIETLDSQNSLRARDERLAQRGAALMLAWCANEPSRIGAVALFEMENAGYVFGRDDPSREPDPLRVVFHRQRPGSNAQVAGTANPWISREQLRIERIGRRLRVQRVGRRAMLVRGQKVDDTVLESGDVLALEGQLVFLCVDRPRRLTPLRDWRVAAAHGFGAPDALGLVGESPTMWRFRDALGFHAKADAHTLVLGPSGVGKELSARALHALSTRAGGPFVARNAATFPPGLVDAELFGNAKNYPNPGMAKRPGLIGAAHGGTLFLDEIGELPTSLHARLLRVLDGDGEYHRLGDASVSRADIRLIGATNRPPDALKHDLLARLPLRLVVPGLHERRDDIPFLVRHLLERALTRNPELVGRFATPDGDVRVSWQLISHLLVRPYETHMRELHGLLWRAMARSPDNVIELPPDQVLGDAETPVTAAPETTGDDHLTGAVLEPMEQPPSPKKPPREFTREELCKAIAAHGGNLARTARALGLASRYVLYRLVRKHNIELDEYRNH